MNNINLNSLKYFYEVALTLNITKTAEILNISQPALTHSIKELESSLNTKLFNRFKSGVTLTKSGEILFQYASSIFNDLGSAIHMIQDENNSKVKIYIGATTTNFLEPIKENLENLKNKYPNVEIDISLESIEVLDNRRKLGKLDILIKNDYELMNNMEIVNSFEIRDSFIASSKHFPLLNSKVFSLSELLNNYPFVLLSNITHGRRNFDNYLKQHNIEFTPNYEFNSYSLCKELIRMGFGIGIGNPIHYESGYFTIIKTDFSLPVRSFDICYNKSSKSEALDYFINSLRK